MTSESGVWLHSASVVILAQSHNPSILNKDFLVKHDVVPEKWGVVETIVSPMLSVIRYANDIRLQVDEQRLEISKECDLPLYKYDDSEPYRLAASYVEVLPHTPYCSLGLNYTVSVTRQDPRRWITKRFLKIDPQSKEFYMMPRFVVSMPGATLNLNLHGEEMLRQGNSQSSVVMDCNLHYDEQINTVSLCDKIRGWADGKKMITDALGWILGD